MMIPYLASAGAPRLLLALALCVLTTACFNDEDGGLPPVGSGGNNDTAGDDAADDDAGDGSSASGDDGASPDLPPQDGPSAELRIVHASPDAGSLDVYFGEDEAPRFTSLRYGDATAWSEVPAEAQRVVLRVSGAAPTATPVLESTLAPDENQRVNGVLAGLAEGTLATRFELIAVSESWGNEVPGRARVRYIHAGVDVPEVAFLGAGNEPVVVTPFGASDPGGETIAIDGGVRLRMLGSAGAGDELTSFTSPLLAEGDEVLLVAAGQLNSLAREPEGLRLLAIGSEGPLEAIEQDPALFVLHGSGDAQLLELCSNSQEIVANFNYGEIVPTRISPGTYDLQIFDYPAGCTGAALNGAGNVTSFDAGERYLVLLTGEKSPDPGEAGIQVAPFIDGFALDEPQSARLRFVHGASYSQIYVGSVTGGSIEAPNVFTQAIAWRQASAEVGVGPGPVLLGIADAVGQPPPPYTPIVTFDYSAQAGLRQWGIVSGDPSPDDVDDRFLQLLLVDSAPTPWAVSIVDVN